ncbi:MULTISPECIES: PKD-like family lipoprotein [Butyricimonas]|uniref:PKD-like family lipoprotein n=2 Tax=Butyricimonas TaxID=574697 RepID=UPI001D080D8B|nr:MULTISPECIES: PKD-like family lipoprotein [Butyricimonas]MCG4519905.1 PKD-like family lipoprotein [Butyricimonas sp. DFI.6.44]
MKMKNVIYLSLLMMVGLFSCIKDEGNYKYEAIRDAKVSFETYTVNCFVHDEVKVEPKIRFGEGDSTDFSYEWRVDYEVVSTERVLEFTPEQAKTYACRLALKDNRNGKVYSGTMSIVAATVYQSGFSILYEEGGVSKLGHINLPSVSQDEEYHAYYDLYREANGEDMGSEPVKLVQHFFWNATNYCKWSELLVIQNGGQGPVELNGNTNEKEVLTREEFVGGNPPENFKLVSAFYPFYMNIVLSEDGKIYTRFFNDPKSMGYHSAAYNNVPVYINKGYKIGQIIETAHQYLKHFLLYDELNGRLIHVRSAYYTTAEEYRELQYTGTYPAGFIPVNNLGDYELVYGAAYGGTMQGSTKYALILRDGDDWKVETFGIAANALGVITLDALDKCQTFSGKTDGYVTDKSIFRILRNRTYIFFSGGANNDELYYYDLSTGKSYHYTSLNGRAIMAMHPAEGNKELGVGLEDGTFILFNVEDSVLKAGEPVVLYEQGGFGRIADVIYKYKLSGRDM